MMFLLLLYVIISFSKAEETFRFANNYADHMVLQREPRQALIWGFGEEGADIGLLLLNIKTQYEKRYNTVVREGKNWYSFDKSKQKRLSNQISFVDGNYCRVLLILA